MKLELRDYQTAAFDQARELIRQGKRRILINAPTGGGKTVLASALMEMCVSKGRRATFVVDRLSLIDQTSAMFFRYGIDHGCIQGDHPLYRPSMQVQVCSVQTLAKRAWPDSDLDVFDEAHVLHASHKRRMGEAGSVVIGLTATPFTKGLGKWFDAVVNVTTTRRLIEQGWLSPYRIFSCAEPDMAGVEVKSTGEWDEKQASDRALKVVGDVVAEYLKHGGGRKFICSAVDTAHVDELVRQFVAAGINASAYTYKEAAEDRADITQEFRRADSSIRGLVTVTAASRGFDVPDVSCIIMARPLRKSLAEHIQLLGRGLRIAPEAGKQDCLVLDHSGNAARFFGRTEEFFDRGIDDLDDGRPKKKKAAEKKEVEPVKCPDCRAVHKPAPHCPVCGHEYPRKVTVQHVAGTLKELIAGGRRRELTLELWPQVAGYAVAHKGDDDDGARRMALAIYRGMTGAWPLASWEDTSPVAPSQEVRNRILADRIRYQKQRQAVAA